MTPKADDPVDKQGDLQEVNGYQDNVHTVVSFVRLLDTKKQKDRAIYDGTTLFSWSIGMQDEFLEHAQIQSVQVPLVVLVRVVS